MNAIDGTPSGGVRRRGASNDASPAALEIHGLDKSFGGIHAVRGVSLQLPIGGRVAVIGPNGAGKTTLFRMIAGEVRPTAGRIRMLGHDVTDTNERSRSRLGLARTFQVSNLFRTCSVLENVQIAAMASTRTRMKFWAPVPRRGPTAVRARAALDRVRLSHRADALASDLSHGEQRQLELAIALVTDPRLILFDEPAAGLSASERVVLRSLLESLPPDISFLLIEHDMSLAFELTDQVLCLDNGSPIGYGTPDQIRADAIIQSIYLGRRGG